ncbi:MAG TPA: hypothetical protein P5243_05345 [Bacteroidales bacterium]|jgi:hypothetical protein|nr:hypothetical protein [Bacteroidales bacterium]HRS18906.1 hypothetical protein [Bacteroidales bacterium]
MTKEQKRARQCVCLGVEFTPELKAMSDKSFADFVKAKKAEKIPEVPSQTKTDEQNAVSSTPAAPTQKMSKHQEKAMEIMRDHDCDEVFRTSDGYWFTERYAAEMHNRIAKGELEVFTSKK